MAQVRTGVQRVAMVSSSFHPYIGGSERQALEVSRALVRRGIGVTVLTRWLPGLPRVEILDGVRIQRLRRCGRGLADSSSFMGSLLWHLALHGGRYDVVHAHMASSAGLAAVWGGALRRLPVFVKVAGGAGFGEFGVAQRTRSGRWKLEALRRARARLLVVSPAQAAEVRALGWHPEPVELPNGVDLERFHPRPDWHGSGAMSVPDGPQRQPIFLAVTRLDEDKSQATTIIERFFLAWQDSRLAGMEAELRIVGDGPAAARLQSRARELGLEDSVRWLGRVEDPAPLYRLADVFLLLSRAEGLSNAMLEAMASGLPVCAARVPGVVERIEPGVHGMLFDPDDASEMAEAVSALAGDRALRTRLGSACRQKAEAEFSLEMTVDRLLRLYGKAQSVQPD